MMHLISCGICEATYNAMREHCPICGVRRRFIASHSFERYRVVVSAYDQQNNIEVVRAYQSTFCADEQQILAMELEAE